MAEKPEKEVIPESKYKIIKRDTPAPEIVSGYKPESKMGLMSITHPAQFTVPGHTSARVIKDKDKERELPAYPSFLQFAEEGKQSCIVPQSMKGRMKEQWEETFIRHMDEVKSRLILQIAIKEKPTHLLNENSKIAFKNDLLSLISQLKQSDEVYDDEISQLDDEETMARKIEERTALIEKAKKEGMEPPPVLKFRTKTEIEDRRYDNAINLINEFVSTYELGKYNRGTGKRESMKQDEIEIGNIKPGVTARLIYNSYDTFFTTSFGKVKQPLKELGLFTSIDDPFDFNPNSTWEVRYMAALANAVIEGPYASEKGKRKIHLRGLHYRFLSMGVCIPVKSGLKRYEDSDWDRMCAMIKKARFAGLIDNYVFEDRRAYGLVSPDLGEIELTGKVPPEFRFQSSITISSSPPPTALKVKVITPVIVYYIEKSAFNGVFDEFQHNYLIWYYSAMGQVSLTGAIEIYNAIKYNGNYGIVFVLTDFDKYGIQISTELARKIQVARKLDTDEKENKPFIVVYHLLMGPEEAMRLKRKGIEPVLLKAEERIVKTEGEEGKEETKTEPKLKYELDALFGLPDWTVSPYIYILNRSLQILDDPRDPKFVFKEEDDIYELQPFSETNPYIIPMKVISAKKIADINDAKLKLFDVIRKKYNEPGIKEKVNKILQRPENVNIFDEITTFDKYIELLNTNVVRIMGESYKILDDATRETFFSSSYIEGTSAESLSTIPDYPEKSAVGEYEEKDPIKRFNDLRMLFKSMGYGGLEETTYGDTTDQLKEFQKADTGVLITSIEKSIADEEKEAVAKQTAAKEKLKQAKAVQKKATSKKHYKERKIAAEEEFEAEKKIMEIRKKTSVKKESRGRKKKSTGKT